MLSIVEKGWNVHGRSSAWVCEIMERGPRKEQKLSTEQGWVHGTVLGLILSVLFNFNSQAFLFINYSFNFVHLRDFCGCQCVSKCVSCAFPSALVFIFVHLFSPIQVGLLVFILSYFLIFSFLKCMFVT